MKEAIKKILLVGVISIIICSMISACDRVDNNKTSRPEQGDKSNYKTEGVEGKASIENVKIEGGNINFQIKNLTEDNTLMSAYLEYVSLEDGKEEGRYPLDCDMIKISANNVSDILSFNPQKPLGKEGIIRIKVLVFENEKGNYNRE